MPVAFYMDVHVPQAITRQLRLRNVDVITATEEKTDRLADSALLQAASAAGRVMVTFDIRFKVLAEDWQRQGKPFAGLLLSPAEGVSIGTYVRDLELIAKASEPAEWVNQVAYLPL